MKPIRIGNKFISREYPCLIMAEIGINHNGDPVLARKMIDAIADSGADCVKFQTFSADEFVSSPDETYEYFSQGKKVKESMLEMFQRFEFDRNEFAALFDYAKNRGLIALSTPTDRHAVDLLAGIGTPAYKVGSDDLVYTQFLDYVARRNKPVIISSGMAEQEDIDRAVKTIRGAGNDQIIILHCVSLYPTPENEVNLRKITSLQKRYDLPIGFSDHSSGITACLGAVTLGACLLEKHFTLDKNLPGPDHWFSADPEELTALVREVRRLEANMGTGSLSRSPAEEEMARLCHRSIVAAREIHEGTIINADAVAFKRPGTGLMPFDLDRILGKKARKTITANSIIDLEDLEDNFE